MKRKLFSKFKLLALGAFAFTQGTAQVTFNYTGGVQTYTVPAGAFTVTVDAYGAQGGFGYAVPGVGAGQGGRVQATLAVTPGEVLNIYVGGQGGAGGTTVGGTAGYNGGGTGGGWSGGRSGGGGGGASDIRQGGTALSNRVIIASGGGGTGVNYSSGNRGGDGGGLTGANGLTGTYLGAGATQSAGGAPNGALGQGGNAPAGQTGGGGGGGYYGGGASAWEGGGGGSSYTATVGVTSVVHTAGARLGNGQITITPVISYTASVAQSATIQCFGQSTASLTATPSGGTAPYTYSWAPSGGTAATASGLAAGTYTVTVTDAFSLVATQTFTVTQPTAISTSAVSQTNLLCNGASTGAATVSASGGTGGFTYSWTPSGGTAPTASGLSAGVYTVTVTDANGCNSTRTFNITQPTALVANVASQTNISCNGNANGAASVTVTGGTTSYSYNWTPGNPTGDGTASVSGLTPGTWTCTVTDGNSCTTTRTFNITQPAVLAASATSQSNNLCNGGSSGAASVTVSGGTTSYSYNWTPGNPTGDGTASVSGLAAGSWTCTVTDANSCTTTQTFNITAPSAVVASVSSSTPVSCFGGSNGSATVSASGGTSGYTYSWAPSGGTSPTASGLTAWVYTVTITDANSCTGTQTLSITQPTALVAAASAQTNNTCSGNSNGTASVTVSGGTSSYSYNWTPGNPAGDGTASVSGLASGTWTCTVTDANSCSTTQTFNITAPSTLVASASSQTNISCNGGSNGSATVTASGGTSGYSYSWAPSGGTAATASGLAPATYTVTVTDANNCTATQTFNITQPSALVATAVAQTNVSCNGGSNGSATVTASGGTSGYSYSWAPSGGTSIVASGLAAAVYTVTVTDANNCTTTQTFNITAPTALVASATSQTNISCNGGSNGSATVTASGGTSGYSYAWSPSGGTAATATGLGAMTYTVTVTDANFCSTTQTFNITQPAALAVTASPADPTSCGSSTGSIDVTVSGGTSGYTYLWSNAATTEDLSGVAAGSYTCTVTDANGCTSQVTSALSDPGAPVVTFTLAMDTVCMNGPAMTLTGGSPSGGTYSGAGVSGGVFTPAAAGSGLHTITYQYTDSVTGCSATSTANIQVEICLGVNADATANATFSLFPNPNNGTFTMQLKGNKMADVYIYDAIGQLVAADKLNPQVQQQINIDTAGVYMITVITADGSRSSQRVVVSK